MNFFQKLWADIGQLPKRTLFLLIVSLTAILAMAVSALVQVVIENRSDAHPIKLAVIAPFTGENQVIGTSIRQGAELYAGKFNRERKLGDRPVRLVFYDEAAEVGNEADLVRKAAGEGAVGVIGHWSDNKVRELESVYQAEQLPLITLAPYDEPRYPEQAWVFRTSFDTTFETRFLANYVRNVLGEKVVNIIHPATPEGERTANLYDETMQRFGSKVLYKWTYGVHDASIGDRVKEFAREINDKKLIGYLLVVGDAKDSASIIAGLRGSNVKNRIIGLRNMATLAFRHHLEEAWKGDSSLSAMLTGTLLTTPLLFDTAGESAQRARSAYITAYGEAPDWVAIQAIDGISVLAHTLTDLGLPEEESIVNQRQKLREQLLEMDRLDKTRSGVNGPMALNPKRNSMPSVWIGNFDGKDLISGLTQLSPIDPEAIVNYLQEVIEGRALYVNDRFMYKTNVVYTGIKISKVVNLDPKTNTAELEAWLWFRWRGKVEPQDIVFTNGVGDIPLKEPVNQGQDGDLQYKLYKLRGKFYLNYTDSKRAYDNELVGIAFHHATLSRNNMMYVTDVLGLNLLDNRTLKEKYKKKGFSVSQSDSGGGGALSKVMSFLSMGGGGDNDPLASSLKSERVLTPVNGWAIENAWVSQETMSRSGLGDPLFVGFGKQLPAFSKMDQGVLLKPDSVRLRDFIPASAFLYMGIFAFLLSILAEVLDNLPGRAQFWKVQTIGLRLLGWPLLLMSLGNLVLDYSLGSWPVQTTKSIQLGYSIMWWIIAARLTSIMVQRFMWDPLELKAKRKVPDSVKSLTTFSIYLFAIFGLTAFVFDQPITSLLATTGATAMIIGLAVKANIDNIFSGIVLNIERPFNIGDSIIYDKVSGKVADITWRTTQILNDNGCIVTVPNSKISAAQLFNFSRAAYSKNTLTIDVPPHYDPQKVLALISDCMMDNPHYLPIKPGQEPKAYFRGVRYEEEWTARYEISIFTTDAKDSLKKASQTFWQKVWVRFGEEGMAWQQGDRQRGGVDMRKTEPAPEAIQAGNPPA
ncbi:MAG: ABC transporter substrate-binding protein [Methylococcaceae bacterium]